MPGHAEGCPAMAPGIAAQGSGAGMETVRDYARRLLDRGAVPVATVLLACRVNPNQVALVGMVLSLVAAALIVDGRLPLAGMLYILAASLGLLNGVLARLAKLASRFGAFLDSTDRVSEGVVLAAIAYHFASRGQPVDAALAVLALLGSVLVSSTRARARAEGLGPECKVGIVTRAGRALLVAFGLMSGLLPEAVYLLVALIAFSAMQRIMHAFRQLNPEG